MKTALKIFAFLCVLCAFAVNAFAVTLPWSASFSGCSTDRTYTGTGGVDAYLCGDMSTVPMSMYTMCSPLTTSVNTTNNYSGGSERGLALWFCSGSEVGGHIAVSSTGGKISLDSSVTEFWFRFYLKLPSTSRVSFGYSKLLYIRPVGGSGAVLDFLANQMVMMPQNGSPSNVYAGTGSLTGWNQLADDQWHSIELHLKDQSGAGASDGIWDTWLDGVQKVHLTNVNWNTATSTGFQSFEFFVNNDLQLSASSQIFLDDFSIANVSNPPSGGWKQDSGGNNMIGPIGWAGSLLPAPTAPGNLRVQ